MNMTKRIVALVMAAMMALSVFSGCKKDKEAGEQKKVSTENVEKYFLYTEAEKLYCLDATTGKSTPIGLDFQVEQVESALVCDDSTKMVARVKKLGQEFYGLIYWDGKSGDAKYLGDNTQLARMSKDGKYIWYEENPEKSGTLYCYDVNKGKSVKIVENMQTVTVSEDGTYAFVGSYKLTGEKDPATGEDQVAGVVCYASCNGTVREITGHAGDALTIMPNRCNVSQDCSAVCYINTEEQDPEFQRNSQVYVWTKMGGEKKLPFMASSIQMFAPDQIYYQKETKDGFSHYYYDGAESYLLAENGRDHGHKVSNYLYYYLARDNGGYKQYVAYKGKVIETSILCCPIRGNMAFVSRDGRSFYGIKEGAMYQVHLDKDGTLTEKKLYDSPIEDFSPRAATVYNETMRTLSEEALYLNDKLIAEGVTGAVLSMDGKHLTYEKNGELIHYTDGKTTAYSMEEIPDSYYTAQNGRLVCLEKSGRLTIFDTAKEKQKIATVGENVTGIIMVETWGCSDWVDFVLNVERTGVWFHRDHTAMCWRW